MTELNQSLVTEIPPVFHPGAFLGFFLPNGENREIDPVVFMCLSVEGSQHGRTVPNPPSPAQRDPGTLEWAAAANQSNFPPL